MHEKHVGYSEGKGNHKPKGLIDAKIYHCYLTWYNIQEEDVILYTRDKEQNSKKQIKQN